LKLHSVVSPFLSVACADIFPHPDSVDARHVYPTRAFHKVPLSIFFVGNFFDFWPCFLRLWTRDLRLPTIVDFFFSPHTVFSLFPVFFIDWLLVGVFHPQVPIRSLFGFFHGHSCPEVLVVQRVVSITPRFFRLFEPTGVTTLPFRHF